MLSNSMFLLSEIICAPRNQLRMVFNCRALVAPVVEICHGAKIAEALHQLAKASEDLLFT